MKLLLDTHIWLWSLLDPGRLTKRVQGALRSEKSELWLSPISLWELQVLVEKGRVEIETDVATWLDEAARVAPMKEAPLTDAVVRALSTIETPHQDPADRFLAATAAILDLQLVTSDEKLLGGKGYRVLANRN
jgi:PIN domain nuclease of toxin-antitoxin system